MTAQDLKNAILQLAVQGKLIPQKPDDEPASELRKRIKVEKEWLIKEGKIKKEKTLSSITDDDIPFDIPENWEWIKLGEVVSVFSGTSYKSKDVCKTGVRILRGGNLQASLIHYYDDDVFLPDSFYEEEKTIRNGDILIVASTGSKAVIGKPGFAFETDNHAQIGAFLRIVRPLNEKIIDFLRVIFDSEFYRNHIRQEVQGMNINNIKTEHITEFVVPLPPLAEQQRIVNKIEELMPLVEEYGKAEERLTELNADFPDKLRKSILQQAIQGKLTERDPADEPASELLKRIHAEKERLGKSKKEKPLPPITEEEMPFEIPDTWEWVRLSNVIDVRDGTHDTPKYVKTGYPLITGKDFYNGYFSLEKTQYVSEADYFEISKRSEVGIGDILFSMIGGNIGSMIRITEENYFPMAIKNVALFKQYGTNSTLSQYLYWFLASQVGKIKERAKGGAQPFVPLNLLRSYPFPLPPIAEQQRIVDRVNELLAVCDGLKKEK